MGKKNKRKQNSSDVQNEMTVNGEEPPNKRAKDQKWYPGKFVLLKPQGTNSNEAAATASTNGKHEKPIDQVNPAKKKKKKLNGKEANNGHSQMESKQLNGKLKKLAKLKKKKSDGLQYLEKADDDLSTSEDDIDWMDLGDFNDSDSLTDEEVGEEWSTDTDYSEGDSLDDSEEYSFHESDCESVSEDGNHFWSDEGSEDSDYVPDIEDKYIKRGDAILYEGNGLNLAFGNSEKSQIIDINDIAPAILPASDDDEVPQLIRPDGEQFNESELEEPEEMIRKLEIDDGFHSNLLLGAASFFNCINDQGVVLKLSKTIHFHGVLIVRCLANKLQINGYTLQPNDNITAPSISRADYFLNLTPIIDSNYAKDNLSQELNKLLKDEDTSKLLSSFDASKEAIVHLQHGPPDSTIEMLKTYSPNPLLPNKKMLMNNSSELTLAAKFFVSIENQKVSTYQENEQWNNIEVKSSSRLVIAGGKNVGKSGLCQFLVNKHITTFKKILLIDLDIGQPISSPAQTVSATLLTRPIIGPGFLSKNQPDKCLMYGDKSVMISPFKYVRCVRQLIEFCSENAEYQNVPWIINSMGYQKGFGLQLICLLVKILGPTDVIQIQHGVKSYNFAKIITEDVVNELEFNFFDDEDVAGIPNQTFFTTHVLDSIVNNSEIDSTSKWISNAAEKRKLSILAQLSRLLKGNQSCLNDVTPFVAPINKIRMLVTDEEYSQPEQGFNLGLLNGNLVYLCKANESETLNSTTILDCYGLGIVRGIDKINEKIFILLPQAEACETLQTNVDVLAIGNIPLPAEILLKQSFNISGNIPHVTFFKDRNASSKKYVNKRNIKECY